MGSFLIYIIKHENINRNIHYGNRPTPCLVCYGQYERQ